MSQNKHCHNPTAMNSSIRLSSDGVIRTPRIRTQFATSSRDQQDLPCRTVFDPEAGLSLVKISLSALPQCPRIDIQFAIPIKLDSFKIAQTICGSPFRSVLVRDLTIYTVFPVVLLKSYIFHVKN
ncbi:hypothetical protein PUN28_015957 [Cardiocondyla obscurior]|uniref:Uncharacterized protein n=1 Tax=Cardiocondyla obscurior TaxID=286306 RepID=A0AAW2ERZ3_9HYME